jgi:hypothetical protein
MISAFGVEHSEISKGLLNGVKMMPGQTIRSVASDTFRQPGGARFFAPKGPSASQKAYKARGKARSKNKDPVFLAHRDRVLRETM